MFDAYSGWDLNYALSWAKQVEQYHPRWIEEAAHPEKIESFATLRRSTSVPVASGEHFYGRWEVRDRYLRSRGAVSVVQADPEWCGGISELVKICGVSSLTARRASHPARTQPPRGRHPRHREPIAHDLPASRVPDPENAVVLPLRKESAAACQSQSPPASRTRIRHRTRRNENRKTNHP